MCACIITAAIPPVYLRRRNRALLRIMESIHGPMDGAWCAVFEHHIEDEKEEGKLEWKFVRSYSFVKRKIGEHTHPNEI